MKESHMSGIAELAAVTIDRWGPIATGGFPARLADGGQPTRSR
jgi:hypothetical protein